MRISQFSDVFLTVFVRDKNPNWLIYRTSLNESIIRFHGDYLREVMASSAAMAVFTFVKESISNKGIESSTFPLVKELNCL